MVIIIVEIVVLVEGTEAKLAMLFKILHFWVFKYLN